VRLATISLLVCLTAAACGGSTAGSTHTPPPAPAVAPPALADGLLTAAQLRPAGGVFVRQPTGSVTDNPESRAPCGAKISVPPLRLGALVVYRSKAPAEVDERIVDLPSGVAERLVGAYARDTRPGCPAYRTATPFGHPQENQFFRSIALPSLGDQRLAVTIRIRPVVRGQRSVYGTGILIREGDRLAFITLAGLRPQSPRVVRAVAIRAVSDMSRLMPASAL
jgi:hypothetical protein